MTFTVRRFLVVGVVVPALAGLLAGLPAAARAAEPAWWTKQKRDCGLPPNLPYNSWNGRCGGPIIIPPPPPQPSPEELLRAKIDDLVANANKAFGESDYAAAIDFLQQAAGLAPTSGAIADLLATARALRTKQIQDEAAARAAEAAARAVQEAHERQETIDRAVASARVRLDDDLRRPIDSAPTAPGFEPGNATTAADQPPGFGGPAGPSADAVDPRAFITPEIYEAARLELARLQQQRVGFEKRLADSRRWTKGLRRDDEEFEAMRQEAQQGLVYEFLDHAPVGSALKEFQAAGYVTPAAKAQIETGWETLKGLVNTWRGITAKDDAERIDKVVDGNRALRKAMVAIPLSRSSESARRWMDGFGQVYDVGAKAVAANAKGKMNFEELANTLVDLGETIAPEYFSLPILGQHLVIRTATYWSAQTAQASLADALSQNWNAERYLSGKLEVIDANIAETEELVNGYQAVHKQPLGSAK